MKYAGAHVNEVINRSILAFFFCLSVQQWRTPSSDLLDHREAAAKWISSIDFFCMLWFNSISTLRRWCGVRGWEGYKLPPPTHPWLTAGHVWVAVFIKGLGHIKLAGLAEDWWIRKWRAVQAVSGVLLVDSWESRCCCSACLPYETDGFLWCVFPPFFFLDGGVTAVRWEGPIFFC